jgi:hypothetical protein
MGLAHSTPLHTHYACIHKTRRTTSAPRRSPRSSGAGSQASRLVFFIGFCFLVTRKLAGWDSLRRVHRTLRAHFHAGDADGWAVSCRRAFRGYGVEEELEAVGWDLDRLSIAAFVAHPVDELA